MKDLTIMVNNFKFINQLNYLPARHAPHWSCAQKVAGVYMEQNPQPVEFRP